MNEQILKENRFIVEFDKKLNIATWQVNYVSRIEYKDGVYSPIVFRLYVSGNEGLFNNEILDNPTKVHIHFLDDVGNVVAYTAVFGKITSFNSSDMGYEFDGILEYEITVTPITVWNGHTPFVNYPKSINRVELNELDDDEEFDIDYDDNKDTYGYFGVDNDF